MTVSSFLRIAPPGIVADADDPRTRCPEGSELLIAPIRLTVEVQAKLIEKRQKLKAALHSSSTSAALP